MTEISILNNRVRNHEIIKKIHLKDFSCYPSHSGRERKKYIILLKKLYCLFSHFYSVIPLRKKILIKKTYKKFNVAGFEPVPLWIRIRIIT